MSDQSIQLMPASAVEQVPSSVSRGSRRRLSSWIGALAIVALAGCASTPETPEQPGATIESRVIGEQGTAVKPQPKDALPQQPVGQPPISGQQVEIDKTPTGQLPPVLSDPKSLLSRRSVFFEYDSHAVRDEFRPMIQAHARFLLDNPRFRITIQGHTDERGSREYNLALGQRRADAVRQAMSVLGVTEKQMEPVSLGEERPRALGTTEAAFAENRRADILYDGEDKVPGNK